MKKLIAIAISLMTFSQVVSAAPYYTGVGCNAEGTKCTFGKPSKRVLNWKKQGTIAELGKKCEKFLENIEARKNVIAQHRPAVLEYRNFHYSWSKKIDAEGQAQIICEVELHSELENVKIVSETYQKFYYVCENAEQAGICKHLRSECEAVRDQALRDPSVLDATVYNGSSLAQGDICYIATAKFK
jgi:hypothetical protein